MTHRINSTSGRSSTAIGSSGATTDHLVASKNGVEGSFGDAVKCGDLQGSSANQSARANQDLEDYIPWSACFLPSLAYSFSSSFSLFPLLLEPGSYLEVGTSPSKPHAVEQLLRPPLHKMAAKSDPRSPVLLVLMLMLRLVS